MGDKNKKNCGTSNSSSELLHSPVDHSLKIKIKKKKKKKSTNTIDVNSLDYLSFMQLKNYGCCRELKWEEYPDSLNSHPITEEKPELKIDLRTIQRIVNDISAVVLGTSSTLPSSSPSSSVEYQVMDNPPPLVFEGFEETEEDKKENERIRKLLEDSWNKQPETEIEKEEENKEEEIKVKNKKIWFWNTNLEDEKEFNSLLDQYLRKSETKSSWNKRKRSEFEKIRSANIR
jgi:hypothetical protein